MFRLLRFVSKKYFYLGIFLRLLVSSCFIATPFALGQFVNAVNTKNGDLVYKYIIINVALFLITQILFYFDDLVRGKIETDSYINFFKKAIYKIENYDEKKSTIDTAKINQEFGQNYELIKSFFSNHPTNVIVNVVYILGLAIMVYSISPEIAISVLILIPVFIIFTYLFQNKFESINSAWINSLKQTKKYLVDTFNLRYLLKNHKEAYTDVDTICQDYNQTATKRYRFTSFFDNALSYSSLNLMLLLVNIFAGVLVFKGKLSIGEFTAISLYVSHLWTPIEKYVTIYTEYLSCNPVITSFCSFFDADDLASNDETIHKIKLEKYSLFSNSKQLNVEFTKGKVYIIIGGNGTGKTTLFTNIINVTKRYNGNIFINENLKKDEHYKKILFFNSEIYESDFFKETSLTDKSMGQKKLFYLKLLKTMNDYDVYLLDEPTNYLQSENKDLVIDIIETLAKNGKIVLVSSHDEILTDNNNFEKVYME